MPCKHENRKDVSSNYFWIKTPQIIGVDEQGKLSAIQGDPLPEGSMFECPTCKLVFAISDGVEIPLPDQNVMRQIIDKMAYEPFGVPNVTYDQALFAQEKK